MFSSPLGLISHHWAKLALPGTKTVGQGVKNKALPRDWRSHSRPDAGKANQRGVQPAELGSSSQVPAVPSHDGFPAAFSKKNTTSACPCAPLASCPHTVLHSSLFPSRSPRAQGHGGVSPASGIKEHDPTDKIFLPFQVSSPALKSLP